MGETKAVRGRVFGKVQGVFFRATMQAEAQRNGARGWVQNQPDGSVAFYAEGAPEVVDALINWARTGSPRAEVKNLETEDVPAEGGYVTFDIHSTPLPE